MVMRRVIDIIFFYNINDNFQFYILVLNIIFFYVLSGIGGPLKTLLVISM